MRKCPICSLEYSSPPAISRIDNITPICPSCEEKEAEYEGYAAVN